MNLRTNLGPIEAQAFFLMSITCNQKALDRNSDSAKGAVTVVAGEADEAFEAKRQSKS